MSDREVSTAEECVCLNASKSYHTAKRSNYRQALPKEQQLESSDVKQRFRMQADKTVYSSVCRAVERW